MSVIYRCHLAFKNASQYGGRSHTNICSLRVEFFSVQLLCLFRCIVPFYVIPGVHLVQTAYGDVFIMEALFVRLIDIQGKGSRTSKFFQR